MAKSLGSLVIVLLLAICTVIAYAGSQAEPPSAQFIAAALRAQEAGCGRSLDVTYSTTFGPARARKTETVHYIRTPDKLMVETAPTTTRKSKVVYDRNTSQSDKLLADKVASSDGIARTAYAGRIGDISGTIFQNQDFVETALYHIQEGPLCDVIGRGTVQETREQIDGCQCWRIEVPSTRTAISKYVVWVDPDVGFCPRQIQILWKDTAPQVVRFEDYREVSSGVWFPMRQTVDLPTPDMGLVSVENSVTDVKVDSAVEPERLSVKYPRGTRMTVMMGPRATTFVKP